MKQNLHIKTPVLENRDLSLKLNKTILNKMECFQPTGAFKNRGICHLCEQAKATGKTALVGYSGGNAGLATAYAGRKLGMEVTIIVPQATTKIAIERIKQQGAEVIVQNGDWGKTQRYAQALAEKTDAAFISPFDHPLIWEGHATLSHELKDQMEKPDAIVLSVGGGGLLCGVLQGLYDIGWEDVPIIAAETKGAESFNAAIKAGEPVTLPEITSIAVTLGCIRVADKAFEWTQKHEIHSVVVSDEQAVDACLQFADDMRVLVEPACGAALAVVYENLPVIKPYQNILIIACGGAGVSLNQLLTWRQELKSAADLTP